MVSISLSYHRGDQHRHRNADLAQRVDGLQTPLRCGRPRFQATRQRPIQGSHRHRHVHQVIICQPGQQVQIAFHQRRFGDNTHRMPELQQHLQNLARDVQSALGGLIGIGVDAQRDRLAAIAGAGQLGAQQCRGVRLVENLGLKIQARRTIQVGV
jgi:hypothetical protein